MGAAKIAVKVAFDSRPQKDHRGIGRYARCLLEALHRSGRGQLIETHDPRRCDVFHAPWVQGAMLRCPVPMVVTVHDLAPLKRPSEYLRSGLRSKLRHLAVQGRRDVPTNAVADDVIKVLDIPSKRVVMIPEAAAPRLRPASTPRSARSASGSACPVTTCCGSAACAPPIPASGSPRWLARGARCRWCSSALPANGRTSFPT